jgi:hypothetical protein
MPGEAPLSEAAARLSEAVACLENDLSFDWEWVT